MAIKIQYDEQVLDIEFRQRVIADILSAENQGRKAEAWRRYECYKDKTSKWVMKSLADDGLAEDTLAQMRGRVSNISICRKIVNKLARTYSGGVIRTATDEKTTDAVNKLARMLSFDDKQKKSDRYRELFRNTMTGFFQEQCGGTDEDPEYRIGMRVLGPWEYDVVEDCFNREKARVVILSDFAETDANQGKAMTSAEAGVHDSFVPAPSTDGKDNTIADRDPNNSGRRRTFIWWTATYHFTTWENGEFHEGMTTTREIEGSDQPLPLNPIGMLPFVNNAEEQDGKFWAEGGEDIVDGSILVNKTITDMFFIQYFQGFGVMVITGQNLKDRYTVGPGKALMFDYNPSQEEPEPKVSFQSASPNIDGWMRTVEQFVALLLTTNNLSVNQISGKLDAATLPSGIALVVEMSEVTQETEDKYSQYAAMEREEFKIIGAWQKALLPSDEVDADFSLIPQLPDDIGQTLSVKFVPIKPVMTESERLANLKARKDLGIDTMIDLIMSDNPDMTKAEAEKKLQEILAEKLEKAATFGVPPPAAGDKKEDDAAPEPEDDAAEDQTEDDETEGDNAE